MDRGELRQHNNLRAVNQAGSEADLEGKTSAELRVFLEQAVGGKGDRRGGGVPGRGDVAGDDDGVRKLELLGEFVDDAHVRLVRDEGGELVCGDAGGCEGLLGDLRHV